MAPRAGFEMDRKLLSTHVGQACAEPNTPAIPHDASCSGSNGFAANLVEQTIDLSGASVPAFMEE
jgi:hypothetical protein